jgi:hypothetical protein
MNRPVRTLHRLAVAAAVICLFATPAARAAIDYYSDLATFNLHSTTTLIETFEGVTPKNTLLASFSSNGVTYTGLAGTPTANVFVIAAGAVNFATPATSSSVLTANGDEDFTLDFDTPSRAVGFDTYINTFGPATIRVYADSGLLDTYVHSHDPTTVGFLGIVSDVPIYQIRWTTVNGGAVNTGIDNVRTGVPEPASVMLLAGLLVSVLRRRV